MSIRVRFAPSPTGHIHVGNVRTALFNYLFARNAGGKFILRIEDTDLERSSVESEQLIYEDLNWLGLEWDEGPSVGGDYGPYRQTERFDLYSKIANEFIDKGYAYKCFCSKEELDIGREQAQKEGKPYIYPGTCASISKADADARVARGESYSIRFKAFKPTVLVKDLIHGDIQFPTNAFGDFIIVRPGGVPIYNYVVVVDDALMKITHIIRGDDHLSNTPKQVLIYEAMGFEPPLFAHIPMILGPDHMKLSKRHGNTSVEQFRKAGYLPEAMINYMSLLSWSPIGEEEIFSKDELINKFSLSRVSKSAAVFDFGKLDWMNGMYIRKKNGEELFELTLPYIIDSKLTDETYLINNKEKVIQMLLSVRDNFTVLGDAPKFLEVYFKRPHILGEGVDEIFALPTTRQVLESFVTKTADFEVLSLEDYKCIMKSIQQETGTKGKPLYMAVRVGLTLATKGPEMDHLATLLPVKELKERIEYALKCMRNN